MGDVLLVGFPALVLLAVLWAVSAALKPRDHGLSDAERYQRELAARSAAHQAAQTQAALAARAKMETHSVSGQSPAFAQGRTPSAHQGNILPNGQLNPQLALQLRAMVRSGQKVQAVKLLRQATHVDFSTAKNYIDRL
jgi:ribosomal protein L7/L12